MTILVALAAAAIGPTFDLKFVATGMTAKMGGYRPIRAEMTPTGSGVKKAPEGLSAPGYGTLKFGEASFGFILDEPAGGAARLYVDSNGNGDYTDDPATNWAARTNNGMTMSSGSAQVKLNGQLATLAAYRFDKNDPNRAALKNTLLYYGDFGFEGTGKFGTSTFKVAFSGTPSDDGFIWIDRNGNGKSDGRSENYAVAKPFNLGGKVYQLKASGNTYEIGTSTEKVDEIPLPPDLTVGAMAPKFSMKATDGTMVNFPETFKGKVVMMDFWATWCGPCIAELPNVKKAYAKYHDKGFEVLGISFDQENALDKLTKFTQDNQMPWRQLYEGKYWNTTIGTQYGVEAIPFVLLVDGSTGKILATVGSLRGEALDKTLEKVFAERS